MADRPPRTVAPRERFALLLALLLPLLCTTLRPSPSAANAAASLPGAPVELRASGEQVATFVPPPDAYGGPRIAAATFIVTYIGFSPEAQAAFQRAVDIWSALLYSPVPIRVDAAWTPLGAGVLGSAGATDYWRDFTGAPQADTWYPVALANKLYGSDLNTVESDISAAFSSTFAPDFYFGADATPPDKINFTSVALHEIGHGLGFSGSLRASGNSGSWGLGSGYPFSYDRFAEDGAGQALLDTDTYPNPSTQLGGALRSNDVWFDGPAAAAAGGTRPKLYAPTPWQQGSSYSHLDEATYGAGNPNSLMTPAIANGETIYSPGPVALGLLQDIGWNSLSVATSGGGTVTTSGSATMTLTPHADDGKTFVGWTVDGVKRGWAVPLTLTLDTGHNVLATFAPTVTFGDVPSNRADAVAITELATRGTIRGYANGNYGPDDGVQRAQMAALIARATGAGPGTPTNGTLTPPACLSAGTWDCEDWGSSFSDRNGLDANLWRNVGALQHYQVAFGYDGAACAARGVASPCYAPTAPVSYIETVVFITRAMIARGYWVAQPNAPQPYAGVPAIFAATVATYHSYTGGVPAPPINWNAGATRGWFARALWQALNTYWGTDLPNLGGYVP